MARVERRGHGNAALARGRKRDLFPWPESGIQRNARDVRRRVNWTDLHGERAEGAVQTAWPPWRESREHQPRRATLRLCRQRARRRHALIYDGILESAKRNRRWLGLLE